MASPMRATVRVALDLDLPIRLETMGIGQENRNLRIGPQRAALFEVPAEYKRTAASPASRAGPPPDTSWR